MHYIPFIYFSCLTYYFWQKHRTFDLSVYMSLLFCITSLCCVLMVIGGFLSEKGGGVLVDGEVPEFGIIPTFLYCGLITITIIPFSYIRPEKLINIRNTHRFTIFAITLFIVLQGVLVLYLVGDFLSDLLNGDFRELKNAQYAGDITPADSKMLTMPMPLQVMYIFCNLSLLGLPLFFYYSCIEKRSLWLSVLPLVASISPILRGMLSADRTEIIHFGLMFLFCIVFFQKFLTKKTMGFLWITSIPIIAVGLAYVVAVSTSRFENEDEGAIGSMLEYAGQSYINFCYFYDHHNPDLYYVEREVPLTSYLLFKKQYSDTKEDRSSKEGFFIGVFASHAGSWLIDTGVMGAILISSFFAILCCIVIHRYNRTEFDIADVLFIYALGAVPTFGIFYYRYHSIAYSLILLTAGLLFLFAKIDFIWSDYHHQKIEQT